MGLRQSRGSSSCEKMVNFGNDEAKRDAHSPTDCLGPCRFIF